jgi:hypothetical protein
MMKKEKETQQVEITPSQAAAALGRLGGSVRTLAKARASRLNGRKGGRPPKVKRPPIKTAIAREMAEIEAKNQKQK